MALGAYGIKRPADVSPEAGNTVKNFTEYTSTGNWTYTEWKNGTVDISTGVDAPSNGQVLAWNAGAAQFKPINPVFNQTGTFDGTFEGTMKGTLVGDDSTILVDGITNTIKLDNGQIFFDGVQIKLLAGNNNLKFGEITDSVGPTFQLYNTDKSQPIEIISVGGTGNDFSKFQFNVKDNSLLPSPSVVNS